jgi:hypothetical protein
MNIVKIKTNPHKLHSEIGHSTRPKIPWLKRNYKIHETNKVVDGKHFLFECPTYKDI